LLAVAALVKSVPEQAVIARMFLGSFLVGAQAQRDLLLLPLALTTQ
jgi:hypothetical protein